MSKFIEELQKAVNLRGAVDIGTDTLEPLILSQWVSDYKNVAELKKSGVTLELSADAPVLSNVNSISAWLRELYSASFINLANMEKLHKLLEPVMDEALENEELAHYEFYLGVATVFYKVVQASMDAEEGNPVKKPLRDKITASIQAWVEKSNAILDAHYPESETFYDTDCSFLENNWEMIEAFNPRYEG